MRTKHLLILLFAVLGFVSCQTDKPETELKQITLYSDNTEIFANGTQSVTFTVKSENKDITSECTIYTSSDNTPLNGYQFKTMVAGTYKFYAKSGEAVSNEIEVVAKEVTPDTRVIELTASTTSLYVNETVTFTVKCNGEVLTEQSQIYNAAGNTPIEGNTFTTSTAGEYTFYAINGEDKSNNIIVTFNEEPQIDVVLTVDNQTIVADGEAKATFTVTADGNDVTSQSEIIVNGENALENNIFSTIEAGEYSFCAVYEGFYSNTVKITATEVPVVDIPLEITASKTTITANGSDYTQFTVTSEGTDMTSDVTIRIKDGGSLNGSIFSTVTAGTYIFYATYGNSVSNEITITAEAAPSTGTSVVFAEGVTLTSGWYDVNKIGDGSQNGDINMCWAAASANLIEWWQDRYEAAGKTLPSTAVRGKGTVFNDYAGRTYELALMDIYHDDWNNMRGGNVTTGIAWYFEGRNLDESLQEGTIAYPLTSGNYWNGTFATEAYPYMYHEYSYIFTNDLYVGEFLAYSNWGSSSGLSASEYHKAFSEFVVLFMSRGAASMVVSLNSNGGLLHATTLWGYEIDNSTGLVTKLWITDSDDLTTEPKTPKLNEYNVSHNGSDKYIKLTGDTRYAALYITALCPFSKYGSN